MTENQQGASGMGKMMNQLRNMVGGDVGGVLDKLKKNGLADQVKSWIGRGENKPVTADQVSQALGNEHIAKIAEQTGVSQQQAAQNIADKLPGMVDKMTPEGDQSALAGARSGMQSAMQGGGMSSGTGQESRGGVESLMRDASGKPRGGDAGPPM
jgi:uncharacterized protein YidB (DUF937 family)